MADGAQNRGFNNNVIEQQQQHDDDGDVDADLSAALNNCSGFRLSGRINRSFHASLRYDKNTAYRIHLMATNNVRAAAANLLNNNSSPQSALVGQNGPTAGSDSAVGDENLQHKRGGVSISRNNSSSTSSSDSSGVGGGRLHQRRLPFLNSYTFSTCQCGLITSPAKSTATSTTRSSITSSSSASQVDQVASTSSSPSSRNNSIDTTKLPHVTNRAATLDSSSSFQRNFAFHQQYQQRLYQHHHPDCSYASDNNEDNNNIKLLKFKKGSAKLQPSPSSASSHSNTSSLFRDDGFEDDLTSTGSEQLSNYQQHRLSFQGLRISSPHNNSSGSGNHHYHLHTSRRRIDDEDEYQSCGEEFTNSNTTASTASNFDDCALSTSSSSIIHQYHHRNINNDQQDTFLDKISLANAKQQYRKSLLIEHQQQQHLLNQSKQAYGQGSRIQSLLISSPKISLLNLTSSSNQSSSSANATNSSGSTTSGSTSSGNTNSSLAILNQNRQPKCDDRTVNIIGHMPTKSPGYWDSNLSITQRVVTEIIETERTYVDDLEQIVTGYICYLRNILKQQQQQQKQHLSHSQNNINSNKQQQPIQGSQIPSTTMVSRSVDDDCKSMLVFDDDTTSATNEIEDYDVDETDNELLPIKDNMLDSHHHENNLNNHSQQAPAMLLLSQDNNNKDGPLITANDVKKLFSNLEDIYKFNKDLLFRLEECYLNPSSVAECFVENASGFEIYTHYCTMYPQVVATLTQLMGNPSSAQLLKERQNELNQGLPLGAYLLKPVQRILKYHILFQSLIKHTSDDETVNEKDRQLIGEAFSVMTSIACHINAMKKRHEHAIRVQEVQGLLSGWEGPDLTTLGELILEDTFKLYNRPKSSRHLFLFDNVLLITKKKRDGSLCYKGHIACSNLMLIENIDGQPMVFNTVPFDNPKALHSFQAKNLDKKRDWCLHLKDSIIKSFDVKIPIHVRDIVMSLTSNSSSKYPSTDTGRAPIKAPNYLERKRSKQEKRK